MEENIRTRLKWYQDKCPTSNRFECSIYGTDLLHDINKYHRHIEEEHTNCQMNVSNSQGTIRCSSISNWLGLSNCHMERDKCTADYMNKVQFIWTAREELNN